MNTLLLDLRYGLRMMVRNPGFTVVVVLTLAFGIGGVTVIFSLFDAIFLRTLPVRHPEGLVRLVYHIPKIGSRSSFPLAYIRSLRNRAKSFDSVFGETGEGRHFAMTDPAPTEVITLRAVTPEFFEGLGVRALYGRVLTAADRTEESGTPAAMISYSFWKRRFGGDPKVARGRAIIVNGHYFVVAGVMPRDFGGLSLDTAPDLWIPMRAYASILFGNTDVDRSVEMLRFNLVARLKPGVKPEAAQAECRAIWMPVMRDYYEHVLEQPPQVVSDELHDVVWLEPFWRGSSVLHIEYGEAIKLLMASVTLIFLIVCTNIAGLLLSKNAARQEEIAVRIAIGATRLHLARQMLTESFLLAVPGAAGGLLMTWVTMPFVTMRVPPAHDLMGWPIPVSLDLRINVTMLLFSLILATLATLFFGLPPTIINSEASLDAALRESRASARMRGTEFLIILQTALCLVLLTAAGLCIRTFRNLAHTNPGFDPSHVGTYTVDLTGQHMPPGLLTSLISRVRGMPDVISVAAARFGVMRGHGMIGGVAPAGEMITGASYLNVNLNDVSTEYFQTMGMRILEGRSFLPGDTQEKKHSGPLNVVVNQALTRELFPNTDPVGKLLGSGDVGVVAQAEAKIIGVVNDSKYRSLREPIKPMIYWPLTELDIPQPFVLYVRTHTQSEAMVVPVQKVLTSVDPSLPIGFADTLTEEVHNSISSERETAVFTSLFGVAATLLTCLGIYGVLAYSVVQRKREIGIRLALGARKGDVLRMVIGQGLRLALIGVVIGIAGAFGLTRFLSSLLYGVKPTDPLTFITVPLLLIAVALLACYIPARRATKVDPMVALRYE